MHAIRFPEVAAWLKGQARSPLAWIVAATMALHTVGIGWGLPASDGWDDDGIAPRDFLVGTYLAYRPGQYFTYPPLHLVFLTLITLPVTVLGLVRSASLGAQDVVAELTRVPYMTAYAFTARAITDLMAAGIVCVVASLGEELWSRRAGLWAAAVAACNSVFTYYAHTSNLDVPYLFWTFLSYLWLVRAVVRGEPKRLRLCALFAVFAVATKDQAYAAFAGTLPFTALLWMGLCPWPRGRAIALRELATSTAGGALLLAFIDGGLVNPSGFAARLRFLVGPASQDHAYYARSLAGALHVVLDTFRSFGRYYPMGAAVFVIYGIGVHLRTTRGDPARRVAGFVPALGVVSFTLAFNCVARRTEHRFVLPQALFVSLYAGAALESLTSGPVRIRTALAWLVAALIGERALFDCIAVDAALLRDPRYEAEEWLTTHVPRGSLIEVYGNNAYLPRLPRGARVERVDPSPLATRSPLPGVTEIDAPYADVDRRRPDWIVMSEGWTWRYTIPPPESPDGSLVLSPLQAARQRDSRTRAFFASLFAETGDYAMAHVARYADGFWPRVDIHASTARSIYILRRRGVDAPEAGR